MSQVYMPQAPMLSLANIEPKEPLVVERKIPSLDLATKQPATNAPAQAPAPAPAPEPKMGMQAFAQLLKQTADPQHYLARWEACDPTLIQECKDDPTIMQLIKDAKQLQASMMDAMAETHGAESSRLKKASSNWNI